MSFVLYTINVECMCDASYVTWKNRQYRRYHVIFARKYKTLQKINIPVATFNSNDTPFLEEKNCKTCKQSSCKNFKSTCTSFFKSPDYIE